MYKLSQPSTSLRVQGIFHRAVEVYHFYCNIFPSYLCRINKIIRKFKDGIPSNYSFDIKKVLITETSSKMSTFLQK